MAEDRTGFGEHLEVLRALAEESDATVPTSLRSSMLAAAGGARAAHLPPAAPGTPAGLLVEVSDALDAELASLTPAQWASFALVGWSVRDVVAHLAAVHEVLVPRLTGLDESAVTPAELHVATEEATDELRGASPHEAAERWRRSVAGLRHGLSVCDTDVSWLGLVVPAEKVIVDRAFETWIHADDIRRATGRVPLDPSDPHLRLLCDLAVELLPLGLLLTERPHDALVTLDLHGPGGGIWQVPLGSGAASGLAFTVQAPARELCLLMGDRVDAADLRWAVHGDDRAAPVVRDLMAAAPVFARP